MPKNRIGLGMLMLLVAFTLLVDVIQAILDIPGIDAVGFWVNIGIDFCVFWILFVWLRFLRVNFKNKSTIATFVAGLVLDLIPFIDIFAWTIDVFTIYYITKAEDKKLIASWQASHPGEE